MYTKTFVELYNQKKQRQVYKIHEIIELEKICILTINNPRNLDIYQIIKIFLVLRSAYIVTKD